MEAVHSLLSTAPRQSPLTAYWLPASIMSCMLYHASTLVCAVSAETLAQVPLSAISYRHRGLAIQLINNGLGDPEQQRSDSTAATILCLANFEVIYET